MIYLIIVENPTLQPYVLIKGIIKQRILWEERMIFISVNDNNTSVNFFRKLRLWSHFGPCWSHVQCNKLLEAVMRSLCHI